MRAGWRSVWAATVVAVLLVAACGQPPADDAGEEPPTGDADPPVEEDAPGDAEPPDDDGAGDQPPEDGPVDPDDADDAGTDGDPPAPDRPPSAMAVAGDAELRMARGVSCWTDPSGEERCADPFGVVTTEEALVVERGEAVRIEGELHDLPIGRVGGNIYTLSGEPDVRGNAVVWTDLTSVEHLDDVALPEVVIDVPAGEYALELMVQFDQGEVAYGIRLHVV